LIVAATAIEPIVAVPTIDLIAAQATSQVLSGAGPEQLVAPITGKWPFSVEDAAYEDGP